VTANEVVGKMVLEEKRKVENTSVKEALVDKGSRKYSQRKI
jgi:hypothetical protein